MAVQPDFKDMSIRWPGHPKYIGQFLEQDIIEVIVQKLEMILFSPSGSVLGDETMGVDLPYYLWQTSIPNNSLKQKINNQITKFIPELYTIQYTFDLELFKGTTQDILFLNFVIMGYNVNFVFK